MKRYAMKRSLSKISWSFLAVGFLAPCLLQSLFYLTVLPVEVVPEWLLLVLWPAFGFFMASDTNIGPDLGRAILGFLISIVANALVYLVVGGLVSFLYRRLFFRTLGTDGTDA